MKRQTEAVKETQVEDPDPELLPCPFCGESNRLRLSLGFVACGGCGTRKVGPGNSYESVAKGWNTRKYDPYFEQVAKHAKEYWDLTLSRAKTKRAKRRFIVRGVFPGFSGSSERRFETIEDVARALEYRSTR